MLLLPLFSHPLRSLVHFIATNTLSSRDAAAAAVAAAVAVLPKVLPLCLLPSVSSSLRVCCLHFSPFSLNGGRKAKQALNGGMQACVGLGDGGNCVA